MPYDLIIVGGGLAGSTLGVLMARAGASVLILEREQRHRDRIRGEGVHPWGVIEARAVGLLDVLLDRCGHQSPILTWCRDGEPARSRDLVETTPSHDAMLPYFHPDMQHILNECAQAAGAQLLRSAHVTEVSPGDPPSVVFTHDGGTHHLTARLLVGADGRRSKVRSLAGFETQRDANHLLMAGVLVSGLTTDERESRIYSRTEAAWMTQFIPLGQGRHRAYFVSGDRQRHTPIGGRAGIASFYEYALDSGVPTGWLDALRIDGPLASFGSGQSLSLRDARVLSERLLANDDWDEAARQYAVEHDAYFGRPHTLEHWMALIAFSVDPALQQVKEHAAGARERGDMPDINGKGPDQPADDAARLRFLCY